MNEAAEDNLRHLRSLARDIENLLGGATTDEQKLLNEIAGMFAVTISATYEGIVRETLVSYAERIHPKYKEHIERDFSRLNAKISLEDLINYSRRFGLSQWVGHGVKANSTIFHKILDDKKSVVERRFRRDMIKSYQNIATWRNAYAHERNTTVTFKGVYDSHRVAQYVIRCFVEAFEAG